MANDLTPEQLQQPTQPPPAQLMGSPLEVWVKGLLAAFIAGGANGCTAAFVSMGIDPEKFNLQASGGGLYHTITLAGSTALISGILGAAAYLKQSPVPPPQVIVQQIPRER